ncbi:hypothetical protein BC6307_19190 [Sutcliffiella cohnii]|uniref:TniQ domain-containing protein n=1 Tax=Sutcliffiella cohnii TaxID=33932 RepID=A0A223KUT4_9BACI|nr:TniQ family protein [Sutcliffiella cohnii]AST93230.1 hypothetical protein BC6307_19190 [Sutcliffiella cohnii]
MHNKLTYNQRSILYNLTPLGLGTEMIESLTSYLTRIAAEHNNSVGQIVNKLVIPNLDKEYLHLSSNYGGNRFYEGAKTLNGYMENSSDVVSVIEKLTSRSDLASLTLLNCRGIIPLRGLFKNTLSWCPHCIREWKENGKSIYYPLIWYLEPIKICLVHSCYLSKTCSACDNTQDILRRQSIVGLCQNCFEELDDCSVSLECENENIEWQNYVTKCISSLLTYRERGLSSESLKLVRNLNLINQEVFEGNQNKFSKTFKYGKSTVCGWLKGDKTPTLINQIYISYRLNIDLEELLFGLKDINNIKVIKSQIIKNKQQEKTERSNINKQIIEFKLKEIIKNKEPISMAAAAKKVGVNKRTLYRNFRGLCIQISKQYKQYIEEKKHQRIVKLKELLEETFINLHQHGIYPSGGKMEFHMNKPGVLKERVLQKHWQNLLMKHKVT